MIIMGMTTTGMTIAVTTIMGIITDMIMTTTDTITQVIMMDMTITRITL